MELAGGRQKRRQSAGEKGADEGVELGWEIPRPRHHRNAMPSSAISHRPPGARDLRHEDEALARGPLGPDLALKLGQETRGGNCAGQAYFYPAALSFRPSLAEVRTDKGMHCRAAMVVWRASRA